MDNISNELENPNQAQGNPQPEATNITQALAGNSDEPLQQNISNEEQELSPTDKDYFSLRHLVRDVTSDLAIYSERGRDREYIIKRIGRDYERELKLTGISVLDIVDHDPDLSNKITEFIDKTFPPEKRPLTLKEKLQDPRYLPSLDELRALFDIPNGHWGLGSDEWQQYIDGKGEFNELGKQFEIWNQEYIKGLAAYIASRNKDSIDQSTILEIGAGNGKLSHFLQAALDESAPGRFRVIATDSSDWNIQPLFPVENIEHAEALEKYKPQLVISSWMPHAKRDKESGEMLGFTDFTNAIRKTNSIQEYILIGEEEVCGDPWLTWGYDKDDPLRAKGISKPYEADGFERHDIEELRRLQIGRNDTVGAHLSSTVSFMRKEIMPSTN